ncbi:MAG: 16S rRNA (cytosine(1402)-N(4))-methyltransferase RsmH [bacterium]|nr:16S rRNA (cytosine(1402)-N(4))-methyltransferase RsmH [bacterium]
MHQPVLIKEVIENLNLEKGIKAIDCTFGQGGHTFAIWEKIKPSGKILAFERDPILYEKGNEKIKEQGLEEKIILKNANFVFLEDIFKNEREFEKPQAILFDLGLSSWHLDESKRGFSFKNCEPLDMRFNPYGEELTAHEIVNKWEEENLAGFFKELGEERFAKRIAEKIVTERKNRTIENTSQLVEIIKTAVPAWYCGKKIHWATRSFQALRILVNQELDNLEKSLPQAIEILDKKGRIAVISYHSLEDRITKHFFKKQAQKQTIKILTKKPIIPSEEEIEKNPRSRSAKLRVVEKI